MKGVQNQEGEEKERRRKGKEQRRNGEGTEKERKGVGTWICLTYVYFWLDVVWRVLLWYCGEFAMGCCVLVWLWLLLHNSNNSNCLGRAVKRTAGLHAARADLGAECGTW